jgi:HK97 family phage portal protein
MAKRNRRSEPKPRIVKFVRKEAQYIAPESPAYFATGVPLPDNLNDLAEAYGNHVWVYAAMKVIAQSIASLPLAPYRKVQATDKFGKSKTSWAVNEKHPWYKLIAKRPNSFMSPTNLKEFTVLSELAMGMSYWTLTRLKNSKEVVEILPITAPQVKVVPAKDKPVDHYVYNVNGKDIRLEPDDVIQFKFMDLKSLTYGQSIVGAAKLPISSDLYAQAWNKQFFKNNARPDAIFETDAVLTDPVRKRMIEGWNERFMGVERRGGIALLEGGLKYKEVNRTPKDLDFLELRKMAREEILAAFGVPPVLVGVFEYANYANSGAQIKLFWENTVLPIAKQICDTLTMRAAQLTGDDETVFDVDLSNVAALQNNMQELAETARKFVDIGIPPNDVIEALDLPFEPFEGGDVSRIPAASGLPKDAPPMDPNAAAKRLKQKQADYVTKGAEAVRSAKWKRFVVVQGKHEKSMELAMRTFFKGQRRRVLDNLAKHGERIMAGHLEKGISRSTVDISLLFDGQKEDASLKNAATQYVHGTYADFAIRTGKQVDPEFDFNLADPRATHFLENKTLKMSREVNGYTEEQITDGVVDAIQNAVTEGLKQGEAIQTVADRINEIYDFAEEGRAERIARTETIGAANAGAEEGMRASGADGKEWLSARDGQVRETHADLDGETTDVTGVFLSPSGAKLAYPGDPSAPPEEIINCRCTVLPVVKGGEE